MWADVNCSKQETVAEVCEMLARNFLMTLKLMKDQMHLNQETICRIHCKHFGERKCAKFGPHSLMN